MIVCNNVGFLHIPRTGGTSIRQALFEQSKKTFLLSPVNKVLEDVRSPANTYNPHSPLEKFSEYHFLEEMTIFTVVRNPWARYVSWFTYTERETGSRRSFDDFLDTLFGDTSSKRNPNLERNPVTQSEYIKGAEPPLYPLRFDKLDRDWKKIAESTGLEPLPLQRLNQAPRPSTYQSYYDEDSMNLVAEQERFLIDTFNFKFEEYS